MQRRFPGVVDTPFDMSSGGLRSISHDVLVDYLSLLLVVAVDRRVSTVTVASGNGRCEERDIEGPVDGLEAALVDVAGDAHLGRAGAQLLDAVVRLPSHTRVHASRVNFAARPGPDQLLLLLYLLASKHTQASTRCTFAQAFKKRNNWA